MPTILRIEALTPTLYSCAKASVDSSYPISDSSLEALFVMPLQVRRRRMLRRMGGKILETPPAQAIVGFAVEPLVADLATDRG